MEEGREGSAPVIIIPELTVWQGQKLRKAPSLLWVVIACLCLCYLLVFHLAFPFGVTETLSASQQLPQCQGVFP